MKSLGSKQEEPTPLYVDNTGAIALAKNDVTHGRTKHMDIEWHFIRERVKFGEIELRHVGTEDQLADIFTKPLTGARFLKLRGLVMGHHSHS